MVEGGDGAEHKSFADGKQREEDNVEWMASSKVIAAGQNNQEDKSHGESDPPHFGMLARIQFHIGLVDKESDESDSDGQLNH